MIGKINIRISAANPQMPLGPFHVFAGSAASFTICDIPLPLGVRKVQGVTVRAKNVDGETRGLAAVRVGSAWGVTVPAGFFSASGSVGRGIVVEASGSDDNGQDVEPWIIGAGDLHVMRLDGSITPGETTHEMHWHDVRPEHPSAGDVAPYGYGVYYFNGQAWIYMGGGGADVIGKLPVKPLPKYLHALSFDDPYKADADAWYESLAPEAMGGACSAVRRGGLLGRNYDWNYDEAAEFVVRMSAADGRHASVGVASLGAALTEDEVMSGVYTAKYRALPGMILDGINDAGVVAEINVIPRGSGDPAKGGVRDLHPLAVVRYVLDHFANAEEAATYVAAHYYIPETSAYSFHWMIADAAKTYIVEDGEKHEVAGADGSVTNYRLYADDVYGTGYKRKEILDDAENVEAALASTHFTNAYAEGWPWPDEFATDAEIPHDETDALKAWADAHVTPHLDPATRKPKARDGVLWNTVHSSIYDFAARTLNVAVQESGEYFTFAAGAKADVSWSDVTDKPETFPPSAHASTHAAGGTDPVTVAQSQVTGLANALAGKRDETNLKISEPKNVHWVWTADRITDGSKEFLSYANRYMSPKPHFDLGTWIYIPGGIYDGTGTTGNETDLELSFSIETDGDLICIATATRASATDTTPVEVDALALVSQLPSASQLLTPAQAAEIAKVKDKADEFTEWVVYGDGKPSGVLTVVLSDNELFWELYINGNRSRYESNIDYQTDTYFQFYDSLTIEPQNFFAKRTKVLRTGDAATPQDVSNAVAPKADKTSFAPEYSTSSAYAVGDYVWHDGEIFQCKVAVAAPGEPWTAAHWDGPQKLRDLFSESDTSTAANPDLNNKVLQASVNVIVAAKTATVATSATAPTSVTLADNDCKTVTMGTATALQIDFGAAKQTGALRLCELVIADAPSTALTLSFPSGHTFHSSMATGKWYTTETGRNHFFFEETAANVWTVTRQVETSDTPTTTNTEGGAE